MTKKMSTAVFAGLLATMAIGCAEEFAPFSRLTSLRVLAIQSEPAAPATGETTTLTPLLYAPPGETIESFEWSWCPFPGAPNEGYPCLITEDDLAELGGEVGEVPPFDLGTGETATLENTLDPELLAAVCAGTPQQPSLLDCRQGFPIQIRVIVRTASEEITAIRRMQMRFSTEQAPNANPVIDGLVAELDGEELVIEQASGPTLPRRLETTIRARVSLLQSETFGTVDDLGMPTEEQERLIISWFTESGDVDAERTSFIRGATELADATENEWEPDNTEDYPRDTSQIVIVLRDSRGGVSWLTGLVGLEAAP